MIRVPGSQIPVWTALQCAKHCYPPFEKRITDFPWGTSGMSSKPAVVLSVKFHSHFQNVKTLCFKPDVAARSAFEAWYDFTNYYGGDVHYPSKFDKDECVAQKDEGLAVPKCLGKCQQVLTRPTDASCWAYSFRWHLQMRKAKGVVLLQVLEGGPMATDEYQMLGSGQKEEWAMARELGIPCWRAYWVGDQLWSFRQVSDSFGALIGN